MTASPMPNGIVLRYGSFYGENTGIGRLLAGEHMVVMMTQVSGSANERAKRELDWRPAHPSWREGFSQALRLSATRSAA